MDWQKIIAFKDEKQKEVGHIQATNDNDTAYFKIVGRIWSWSADEDSILRTEIDKALSQDIKKAVVYASSPGGSVFATYEISNLLEKFTDVKIEVGALMASALTYLTSKFHTTIKSNTQGMIHMPMTSVRGNLKDVKADLKLLENITEDYAQAYATKTGKTVEEIKELWADGDYWMNASELKKEGFVDAIAGEIEAFSDTDVMELQACGAPSIPKRTIKQSKNTNTMDREKLIALYGLEATATDSEIEAAAKKQKVDAFKFREAEKKAKEDQEKDKQAAAVEIVDKAIQDKKITAEKKDHFLKLAAADLESTKSVLEAMTAIPQLTKEINPQASADSDAARDKWSLDDWIEKDPEGYKKMLAEGSDVLARLENEYFTN